MIVLVLILGASAHSHQSTTALLATQDDESLFVFSPNHTRFDSTMAGMVVATVGAAGLYAVTLDAPEFAESDIQNFVKLLTILNYDAQGFPSDSPLRYPFAHTLSDYQSKLNSATRGPESIELFRKVMLDLKNLEGKMRNAASPILGNILARVPSTLKTFLQGCTTLGSKASAVATLGVTGKLPSITEVDFPNANRIGDFYLHLLALRALPTCQEFEEAVDFHLGDPRLKAACTKLIDIDVLKTIQFTPDSPTFPIDRIFREINRESDDRYTLNLILPDASIGSITPAFDSKSVFELGPASAISVPSRTQKFEVRCKDPGPPIGTSPPIVGAVLVITVEQNIPARPYSCSSKVLKAFAQSLIVRHTSIVAPESSSNWPVINEQEGREIIISGRADRFPRDLVVVLTSDGKDTAGQSIAFTPPSPSSWNLEGYSGDELRAYAKIMWPVAPVAVAVAPFELSIDFTCGSGSHEVSAGGVAVVNFEKCGEFLEGYLKSRTVVVPDHAGSTSPIVSQKQTKTILTVDYLRAKFYKEPSETSIINPDCEFLKGTTLDLKKFSATSQGTSVGIVRKVECNVNIYEDAAIRISNSEHLNADGDILSCGPLGHVEIKIKKLDPPIKTSGTSPASKPCPNAHDFTVFDGKTEHALTPGLNIQLEAPFLEIRMHHTVTNFDNIDKSLTYELVEPKPKSTGSTKLFWEQQNVGFFSVRITDIQTGKYELNADCNGKNILNQLIITVTTKDDLKKCQAILKGLTFQWEARNLAFFETDTPIELSTGCNRAADDSIVFTQKECLATIDTHTEAIVGSITLIPDSTVQQSPAWLDIVRVETPNRIEDSMNGAKLAFYGSRHQESGLEPTYPITVRCGSEKREYVFKLDKFYVEEFNPDLKHHVPHVLSRLILSGKQFRNVIGSWLAKITS